MSSTAPTLPAPGADPAAVDLAGWPWAESSANEPGPAPTGGWPRISILCPSYQQADFLEETIRSVLLQRYPALEFIVMDGGSTDGSRAILERYAPWLAHWESKPDRGQSDALNQAAARATGELIGWINSDDYYLPGALAAVGRAFRETPRRIFFGDSAVRHGTAPALTVQRERPALAFQVAVGGRQLPSHATFWPRADHQPFNESLQFTMDADLFKRLTSAGLRPRYLPRTLSVVRLHPAAKTARLLDVARAETEAWSRAQPWHTHWRWRCSRLVDGVIRRLPRS